MSAIMKEIEIPAPISRRIGAYFIDLGILMAIAFPIVLTLPTESITFATLSQAADIPGMWIAELCFAILGFIYFTVLEYTQQQSIGKRILNIRVKNEDLTLLKVIGRNVFMFPYFPFTFLYLADPIFMIIRKDGKRLSEIITKTSVVYTSELYLGTK